MRAVLFCSVLLLTSVVAVTRSQTPTFQTDEATQAVSDYLRTVEEARKQCLTRLAAAEKAALKSGNREDVATIQSARAAVETHRAADVFDPFAALEHQIAGSKWANRDNARLWSAFDKDHTLRNVKGEAGKWAVVAEDTVASTTGNKYVYLWVFGEDGRTATLQRFNHDKDHTRPYVRQ